jgi:hypothetical protein
MVPAVRPLGPLSMARGCARIDSRPDTAKIGSADRVEVHHARLLAVIGVRKTFPHGLGQKLKSSRRANVFRFAPESGHRVIQSACPFRANFGSRPDLLDAEVTGFSKCDSRNTMHGPLKGVLAKDLESAAMVRERDDWGYYVRAIRDLTHPPSWRWRIIRRGKPMGVLLEAGGFSTYEAARFGRQRCLS